jgi:L-ascorbate metabolism protein UlaG (beta-lactamase superfamily)
MNIQFLGHACIYIHGSKNILIDPFIRNNPKASIALEDLPKPDYILVTHDHSDHMGDTIELLKRDSNTACAAIFEIMQMPEIASLPNEKIDLNIGGSFSKDGITIRMTQALHSATLGTPAGFVVEMEGKRIYHSGDTAYFRGIADLPRLYGSIDVACLPIGGHYTMDTKQAACAIADLQPKKTIPIHYNTWPIIEASPDELKRLSGPYEICALIPGESLSL